MRVRARRPATILAVLLSALVAEVPAAAASSPSAAPVVVGIVLREVGPAFAVIEDSATSKAAFYQVGARVGGAVITQILADRVILVAGDQQTQIRLATLVSSASAAAAVSPAPRDDLSGSRRPPGPGADAAEAPRSPYGRIATVTAPAGAPSGGGGATGGDSQSPMGIAAQAGGPGGASGGTQNGLSAFLTVTGRLHNGQSQPGDEFSTTSLRDLLISMTYANLTGSHQQRLELYAPDGSLYQKLTGAVAPSTQSLIPVGGTWITDHSLFGSWRVDVYVDRETTPIASQAFTLTR